jgi:hypothetical protein
MPGGARSGRRISALLSRETSKRRFLRRLQRCKCGELVLCRRAKTVPQSSALSNPQRARDEPFICVLDHFYGRLGGSGPDSRRQVGKWIYHEGRSTRGDKWEPTQNLLACLGKFIFKAEHPIPMVPACQRHGVEFSIVLCFQVARINHQLSAVPDSLRCYCSRVFAIGQYNAVSNCISSHEICCIIEVGSYLFAEAHRD